MNYKTRRERRAATLKRDKDGHRLTFHGPPRLIRYWIHPRCITALLIQHIQPVSAGLNNVSVLQRYGMTSNSSSSDVGASSMTSKYRTTSRTTSSTFRYNTATKICEIFTSHSLPVAMKQLYSLIPRLLRHFYHRIVPGPTHEKVK